MSDLKQQHEALLEELRGTLVDLLEEVDTEIVAQTPVKARLARIRKGTNTLSKQGKIYRKLSVQYASEL